MKMSEYITLEIPENDKLLSDQGAEDLGYFVQQVIKYMTCATLVIVRGEAIGSNDEEEVKK